MIARRVLHEAHYTPVFQGQAHGVTGGVGVLYASGARPVPLGLDKEIAIHKGYAQRV